MRLEQRGWVKRLRSMSNRHREEAYERSKTVQHPKGNLGWRARLLDGSGVSREVHAPFCERLRVKSPRPTLQIYKYFS